MNGKGISGLTGRYPYRELLTNRAKTPKGALAGQYVERRSVLGITAVGRE